MIRIASASVARKVLQQLGPRLVRAEDRLESRGYVLAAAEWSKLELAFLVRLERRQKEAPRAGIEKMDLVEKENTISGQLESALPLRDRARVRTLGVTKQLGPCLVVIREAPAIERDRLLLPVVMARGLLDHGLVDVAVERGVPGEGRQRLGDLELLEEDEADVEEVDGELGRAHAVPLG